MTGKLIMQRTNSNISKGQNKRMKLKIYASPIINKTENNVKKFNNMLRSEKTESAREGD